MQTVTTIELSAAFVTAILAIAPTMEALRSVKWAYVPSPRAGTRAALPRGTRNFDLLFRDARPTFEWKGGIGTAYKVSLAVAVSYSGVEPATRQHLKAQDAVDIYRALARLRDPTVAGFVNIEPTGEANEITDEANAYVEHSFTVSYHQATAA